MRGVIWLVLLFAVAVVAAITLGSNDGLVSLYWSGWRTDLSLNLFIVLWLLAFLLLSAAGQALISLVGLPRRARQWRELRRERAAHAHLQNALAEHFAARFSRANRAAQRALQASADVAALRTDAEFQTLAHTLAASSLHQMQDRGGRDAALALLPQSPATPAARTAADGAALLAVQWALDDRDAERALARLADMPAGVARRTHALRLRLQAQRLARQPVAALHTARQLAKHQAFTAAVASSLMRALAYEALEGAHDSEQLRRVWAEFEASERSDALIVARAALRASALGAPEDARTWLRPLWEGLAEQAPPERAQLALALMESTTGMGTEWLPRLEAALARHADEPAVVAAVGAAFAERQLWGKARRALEAAASSPDLAAGARRRITRMLASLARDEGDEPRAQQFEQRAAAID